MDFEYNYQRAIIKKQAPKYLVNKKLGMEESIDELMIMVSGETKWMLNDLLGMDVIKFIKIVHTIQETIKQRNDEIKKQNSKQQKKKI